MLAIFALLIEMFILSANNTERASSVSDITASFLILFFTIVFIISIYRNDKFYSYKHSIIAAYLLRVFFLYFDLYARKIFILPNSAGDSEMFYNNMVSYSRGLPYREGAYIEVMGTLFKFVGTNRLYGQFLNMLCSVIALIILAYTLNEIDISESVKKRIYLIICLLPNYAILSSILLRESFVSMFLTISFYYFVRWYKYKQGKDYIWASVFVFPAAAMHSGSIAVLVGYIAILLIYDNRSERITLSLRNIISAFIFIALATIVIVRTGNRFLGKFSYVDSIEDIAKTTSIGDSSYAQYVGNSDSLSSMLLYSLPRVFYFTFSPLPWQWRGLGDVIMFIFSSLVYIGILIKMIQYLRLREAKYRAFVLVLFIVAMVTVYVFAWGTSNVGTAVRHRDKIITLFALIWTFSCERQEEYEFGLNY